MAFSRQALDSAWRMQVEDSWSIYDQLDNAERTWELSESRCSTDECLQIIDRSLAQFHTERPGAKLGTLDVEMQVIRDLWRDVLVGLNQALSTVNTQKGVSGADMPDEVDEELQRVASKSAVIGRIKTLFNRHGMSVGGVYPSMITFKDSLTGHSWSEISQLPDEGVLLPGMFEFDLGVPSARDKLAGNQ